jgi:hypothetical protein
MQTHINQATDQLPASAVITLDQPEQFRTGHLDVQTLTLDNDAHVRFSGTNWADNNAFMERDHDYPVTTPFLQGPVRQEAQRVSEQINTAHGPESVTGPGPANWAQSDESTIMPEGLSNTDAAGWIKDHTPDTTAQITADATNPQITDNVLPLNPKGGNWDNSPVPTRAEQLWRKDNPTRDDVVNNIAGQLAASGTSDADAFRVGENFMSMYDDPKAAMASWTATVERQGIAPAQMIAHLPDPITEAVKTWDDPLPLTRDQAANKIADELVASGRGEMDALRIGNLRVDQYASAGKTPDDALAGFQAERTAARTADTQPVSADFLQGLPRETPSAGQAAQVQDAMKSKGVPAADRAAAHWAGSMDRNGGGNTVNPSRGVDQAQLNASMARHPAGRGIPIKK